MNLVSFVIATMVLNMVTIFFLIFLGGGTLVLVVIFVLILVLVVGRWPCVGFGHGSVRFFFIFFSDGIGRGFGWRRV